VRERAEGTGMVRGMLEEELGEIDLLVKEILT